MRKGWTGVSTIRRTAGRGRESGRPGAPARRSIARREKGRAPRWSTSKFDPIHSLTEQNTYWHSCGASAGFRQGRTRSVLRMLQEIAQEIHLSEGVRMPQGESLRRDEMAKSAFGGAREIFRGSDARRYWDTRAFS